MGSNSNIKGLFEILCKKRLLCTERSIPIHQINCRISIIQGYFLQKLQLGSVTQRRNKSIRYLTNRLLYLLP